MPLKRIHLKGSKPINGVSAFLQTSKFLPLDPSDDITIVHSSPMCQPTSAHVSPKFKYMYQVNSFQWRTLSVRRCNHQSIGWWAWVKKWENERFRSSLCMCVCGGGGSCQWGIDDPVHPSATILWPRVTCLNQYHPVFIMLKQYTSERIYKYNKRIINTCPPFRRKGFVTVMIKCNECCQISPNGLMSFLSRMWNITNHGHGFNCLGDLL